MIRKLVLKRLGGAVVTLLLASIVIFLLVRLAPGDPVNLILGEGPGDIGPVSYTHLTLPTNSLV